MSGRRIEKRVVDLATPSKLFVCHYAYDGQEMVGEYDGANHLLETYTHSTLRTDDVLALDVTEAGKEARQMESDGSGNRLAKKEKLMGITGIAKRVKSERREVSLIVALDLLP